MPDNPSVVGPPPRRRWVLVLLLAVFVFRLGFGLSSNLFTEDETQVYLLGLRFHASHHWPFFGPDVNWTQSEIPGALQPLLVGTPFDLWPIPEAPYILLNVLSMGSLCLFAAYLSARLPRVPRWLLWGWVLTIPWTLDFSTHILNTSYILPASLVFFLGFFESWPPLAIGRVRPTVAHALMGLSLGWIIQIHMSWPLLLPFIGAAFLARLREGPRACAASLGAFALGAAGTGILLVPTLVQYGLSAGSGGTAHNLHLHWRNPLTTVTTTTARFLSFASLEVPRFLATGSPKQIVFLQQHLWLVPVAGLTGALGIIHPVWMATTAFRRRSTLPDWPAVRWLAVLTVLLVSTSYFFVMEPAQARSFYIVAPVALAYAAYCWTFLDSPRWRMIAAGVVAVNLLLRASLALIHASGPSLYLDRPLLVEAIRMQEPDLFAHRRPYARDVAPDELASAVVGADAPGDLVVEGAAMSRAFRDLTVWSLAVHNRSTRVAYRDLRCETRYEDRTGTVIEQHDEDVWIVVQPGETVRTQVIDGARWTQAMAHADARIVAAQPLRPTGSGADSRKPGLTP
jgi:hypothetical protein